MSPRGGRRPNQTGRPLRGGAPSASRLGVWLTEAERAEIEAGRIEGESLSDVLREGALALVRARRA